MKLTKLKGIAHDLAHHLADSIWFGEYKDSIPKDFKTNILEMKDYFDKNCLEFFKQRLPKSFDLTQIKSIIITIKRSMTTLSIEIKINYNKKETSYQLKSSRG